MKSKQRVLKRGSRPAKATKKPSRTNRVVRGGRSSHAFRQLRDLGATPLDYASLERKPYLTIPELVAYGSFDNKRAAYHFLSKYQVAWAAGRVKRRDFDRAHERASEERQRRHHSGQFGRRDSAASSESSSLEAR